MCWRHKWRGVNNKEKYEIWSTQQSVAEFFDLGIYDFLFCRSRRAPFKMYLIAKVGVDRAKTGQSGFMVRQATYNPLCCPLLPFSSKQLRSPCPTTYVSRWTHRTSHHAEHNSGVYWQAWPSNRYPDGGRSEWTKPCTSRAHPARKKANPASRPTVQHPQGNLWWH